MTNPRIARRPAALLPRVDGATDLRGYDARSQVPVCLYPQMIALDLFPHVTTASGETKSPFDWGAELEGQGFAEGAHANVAIYANSP